MNLLAASWTLRHWSQLSALAVQPIFHPPFNPLVQPVSHQFCEEENMGDYAKG